MEEKNEKLSDLQSTVVQMRVKFKDSIINRMKQNTDIELDILKHTKIIPVYQPLEINIPELRLNTTYIQTALAENKIDVTDLDDEIKEIKGMMKVVSHQRQCKITKKFLDNMF